MGWKSENRHEQTKLGRCRNLLGENEARAAGRANERAAGAANANCPTGPNLFARVINHRWRPARIGHCESSSSSSIELEASNNTRSSDPLNLRPSCRETMQPRPNFHAGRRSEAGSRRRCAQISIAAPPPPRIRRQAGVFEWPPKQADGRTHALRLGRHLIITPTL